MAEQDEKIKKREKLTKDQLDLAEKLHAASVARTKNLTQQTKELEKQLALQLSIKDIDSAKNLDDVIEKIRKSTEAIKEVVKEAEKLDDKTTSLSDKLDKQIKKGNSGIFNFKVGLKKFVDMFPKGAIFITKFWTGFSQGMSFSFNLIKSGLSLVYTMVEGLYEVGKALISIPFKAWDGLVDLSNKARAMFEENARAIENIRKAFGDLAGPTAKDVISSFRHMQGQLASTGKSVYSIFGNAAERLEYVLKLGEGLGPMLDVFGTELNKNIEYIGSFQKALGLTEEDMKDVAMLARSTGRSWTLTLKSMATLSLGLSKSTGVSQKIISKGMAVMTKDVSHFGAVSQRSMAEATVYTRKLGIEVKSLGGIVDKFLNFEDAATNAAKLSQVFGTNIDTLELMKTAGKDPAKTLQLLQQSFFSTGRSAEKLTLAELRYLSSTVGLSEAETKLAFSVKNRGLSLDQIKKKSGEAQKKEVSLEQTISNLSGAIERMIKQDRLTGGFFNRFLEGFARGVAQSKPFMDVLRAIDITLKKVTFAGIEVGKMFVNTFPGIKDILQGFFDLLNPKKITQFLDDIKGDFKVFFDLLAFNPSKPQEAIKTFFTNIEYDFSKFMGENGSSFKKIKEGFKTFGILLWEAFKAALPIALDGMTSVFDEIYDFLDANNPKSGLSFLSNAGELQPKLEKAFQAFGKTLGKAVEVIWPIVADTFANLFNNISDAISGPEGAVDQSQGEGFLSPVINAFKNSDKNTKLKESIKRLAKNLLKLGLEAIGELDWKTVGVVIGPPIVSGLFQSFGTYLLLKSGKFALEVTKELGSKMSQPFKNLWDKLFKKGTIANRIDNELYIAKDKIGSFYQKVDKIPGKEKLSNLFSGFGGKAKALTTPAGATKAVPWIGFAINAFGELSDTMEKNEGQWGSMFEATKKSQDMWTDLGETFLSIGTFGLSKLFPWTNDLLKYMSDWSWDWLVLPFVDWNEFLQKKFGVKNTKLGEEIGTGLKIGLESIPFILPLENFVKQVINLFDFGSPSKLFTNFGKMIVEGLKKGMDSLKDSKILGPFMFLLERITDLFKIDSPSKVFMDMGENISKGFEMGMVDMPTSIQKNISESITSTRENLKMATRQLTSDVNNAMTNIPTLNIKSRLGKDLEVKDQKFTVESNGINMNMNLNIIMEADTVAEAIVKTRKVISSGKKWL